MRQGLRFVGRIPTGRLRRYSVTGIYSVRSILFFSPTFSGRVRFPRLAASACEVAACGGLPWRSLSFLGLVSLMVYSSLNLAFTSCNMHGRSSWHSPFLSAGGILDGIYRRRSQHHRTSPIRHPPAAAAMDRPGGGRAGRSLRSDCNSPSRSPPRIEIRRVLRLGRAL